MYIRWKTLIGFGTLLWILLCVTDFFSENAQQQYKRDEWFAQNDREEFKTQSSARLNQMHVAELELEDALKFSWNLIFWNFIAFTSTIFFCGLLRQAACKIAQIYLKQKRTRISLFNSLESDNPDLREASTITLSEPRPSSSKIPVPVPGKLPEGGDRGTQIQQALKDSASSLIIVESKKSENERFGHHQHMEKQCAKLREEMLMVQASSFKEHTILSRKLDAVTREKRELSKQLAIAHKENRAAKQQLDELLTEKSMLLRRLENATKEFKINTKNKKLALAKLEEAHEKIDALKKQLEQVLREKMLLEGTAKFLVEECQNVAQSPEKDVPSNSTAAAVAATTTDPTTFNSNDNSSNNNNSSSNSSSNNNNNNNKNNDSNNNSTVTEERLDCSMNVTNNTSKEHAIDKTETLPYEDNSTNSNIGIVSKKNFDDDDPAISQAAIDMKKIQMKIEMLEKNLEKFKVPRKHGQQQQDSIADNNNKRIDEIVAEQTPLPYKEIFTRKRHHQHGDDDREKFERLLSSSPGQLFSRKTTTSLSDDEVFPAMHDDSNDNLSAKKMKTDDNSQLETPPWVSSCDDGNDSAASSLSLSTAELETTTSSDEGSAGLKKKGIVSTSPAFQQFLRKLESVDRFPKIEAAQMLLRL